MSGQNHPKPEPKSLRSPSQPIAVAICVHNGRRFIVEQLESISRQSRPPDAIVIVDDHSDDGSRELVESFDLPCPSLLLSSSQGISGPESVDSRIARNFYQALEACPSGSWVAFADQDDVWAPTHLERLAELLARNPLRTYAFSDACFIDEANSRLPGTLFDYFRVPRNFSDLTGPQQLRHLIFHSFVTGMSMMVRRDPVMSLPAPPPGVLHDRWISLIACASGGGVATGESLTEYRQHGAQVVGATGGGSFQARMRRALRRGFSTDSNKPVFLVDITETENRVLSTIPEFQVDEFQRILARGRTVISAKKAVNRIVRLSRRLLKWGIHLVNGLGARLVS